MRTGVCRFFVVNISMNLLTNTQGALTLAKSYQPYGETLSSAGNGSSPFAFTGEQADVSGENLFQRGQAKTISNRQRNGFTGNILIQPRSNLTHIPPTLRADHARIKQNVVLQ